MFHKGTKKQLFAGQMARYESQARKAVEKKAQEEREKKQRIAQLNDPEFVSKQIKRTISDIRDVAKQLNERHPDGAIEFFQYFGSKYGKRDPNAPLEENLKELKQILTKITSINKKYRVLSTDAYTDTIDERNFKKALRILLMNRLKKLSNYAVTGAGREEFEMERLEEYKAVSDLIQKLGVEKPEKLEKELSLLKKLGIEPPPKDRIEFAGPVFPANKPIQFTEEERAKRKYIPDEEEIDQELEDIYAEMDAMDKAYEEKVRQDKALQVLSSAVAPQAKSVVSNSIPIVLSLEAKYPLVKFQQGIPQLPKLRFVNKTPEELEQFKQYKEAKQEYEKLKSQ